MGFRIRVSVSVSVGVRVRVFLPGVVEHRHHAAWHRWAGGHPIPYIHMLGRR